LYIYNINYPPPPRLSLYIYSFSLVNLLKHELLLLLPGSFFIYLVKESFENI
jgi:hypothetical protein